MGLTQDVISEFVKIANSGNKKPPTETTVNGTAVTYEGRTFVRIDGSDALVPTPVTSTVSMKDGDRVQVLIKDHAAIVTGNLDDPSASSLTVKEQGTKISEFEIIIADKVSVEELEAERARIKDLETDNVVIKNQLTATEANIQKLTAADVTITGRLDANEASVKDLDAEKISADIVEATYATIASLEATDAKIYNLSAVYGDFEDLTTGKFEAIQADITSLETDKLSATDAELLYANIDFANIGEAAVKALFAKSGIIKELTTGDAFITGELVGVTIDGDLIKGNTIIADKLVIKGEDGLYYQMNVDGGATVSEEITEEQLQNGLHGDIIIANTITANKIKVEDLVAFGATIGGFEITNDSIHSQAKKTADSTTQGIYMDNTGQMAFGDSDNFVRYYKDKDGKYQLEITAQSILFGSGKKSVDTAIQDEIDKLKIGGRNLLLDSTRVVEGDAYSLGLYDIAKPDEIEAGAEYTISFEGTMNEEVHTGFYVNVFPSPHSQLASGEAFKLENGRYYATFTMPSQDEYTQICVYMMPLGSYTLGGSVKNIKLERGNKATDWTPAPEDVEETIVDTTNEIQESIINQHSSITGEYETAILKALEDYNKTGEFEEFKNAVLTDLGLMGEEIDSNLNSTTDRINSVDADLQSKFANLDNYVHIDNEAGTITLGSGDSKITLTLENDAIVFRKRGELEPFGYWNGVDFYTGNIVVRTEQRAQFGNFAFVPRTDGSLSFLKVGDS